MLSRFRLALALLFTFCSAQAQLWATPQQTAKHSLLSGFKVESGGKVLRSGQTKVMLDSAGGRVVGILIEGDTAGAARALAAAWDMDSEGLADLITDLNGASLQKAARSGYVTTGSDEGTDLIALKLTGTGTTRRWRIYAAINILPESRFMTTRNVIGKADAPNKVHVLSDFQCPACQQLWEQEMRFWRGQKEYRVAYHHFPLSYHKNAFAAAEASECAAKQGQFWRYGDLLFAEVGTWGRASAEQANKLFKSYAGRLKLGKSFEQCFAGHQTKAEVKRQMAGGEAAYLQGTPTVYLNGIKLVERSPAEIQRIQAVTRAKPSAAGLIAERLKTFK